METYYNAANWENRIKSAEEAARSALSAAAVAENMALTATKKYQALMNEHERGTFGTVFPARPRTFGIKPSTGRRNLTERERASRQKMQNAMNNATKARRAANSASTKYEETKRAKANALREARLLAAKREMNKQRESLFNNRNKEEFNRRLSIIRSIRNNIEVHPRKTTNNLSKLKSLETQLKGLIANMRKFVSEGQVRSQKINRITKSRLLKNKPAAENKRLNNQAGPSGSTLEELRKSGAVHNAQVRAAKKIQQVYRKHLQNGKAVNNVLEEIIRSTH
jgi:hypothetical protein